MHASLRTVSAVLLAACAAALPLAAQAQARSIIQSQVMLSADNCQAALPAFDGNIRKRPMAMQNEGASAAFITCAFKGLPWDPRTVGNDVLGVALSTQTAQTVSVTCTLANGTRAADAGYVTKTKTVYPGIANLLLWTPPEFGFSYGTGLDFAAMSCSLPPGASILYTLRRYEEFAVD